MVLEADYLKLQNSPILNHYSMHLGIEKIAKGLSVLYGLQELMPHKESLIFLTPN